MWLILTLGLLLAGCLLAWFLQKRAPRLRKALLICMAICILAVGAGTAACWNPPEYQDLTPDYAVLLGGGEKDGQPTASTENRLFLALNYLEATPDVMLIVTGGDPNGNGVTEAEVMASWLRDHGADMDRILSEDRANDTLENLQYSKALAASRGLQTDSILILTSDYHQTRAQFLARQLGQEASGLACETPFLSHLAASVREAYSFVKAIWQTR
ncbi:MAG: YdcF family protein [Candidatus Avoscillospira sp.]